MSSLSISTIASRTASTPVVFNDSNGVQVGQLCRAWVNFNGTGTVAMRDSFRVSSITDNGTGDYTINFSTAMPTVNYCVVGTPGNVSNGTYLFTDWQTTRTVSALRFATTSPSALTDCTHIHLAVFGD